MGYILYVVCRASNFSVASLSFHQPPPRSELLILNHVLLSVHGVSGIIINNGKIYGTMTSSVWGWTIIIITSPPNIFISNS